MPRLQPPTATTTLHPDNNFITRQVNAIEPKIHATPGSGGTAPFTCSLHNGSQQTISFCWVPIVNNPLAFFTSQNTHIFPHPRGTSVNSQSGQNLQMMRPLVETCLRRYTHIFTSFSPPSLPTSVSEPSMPAPISPATAGRPTPFFTTCQPLPSPHLPCWPLCWPSSGRSPASP